MKPRQTILYQRTVLLKRYGVSRLFAVGLLSSSGVYDIVLTSNCFSEYIARFRRSGIKLISEI